METGQPSPHQIPHLAHATGSENVEGGPFYTLWLAPRTDQDLKEAPLPSKTQGKEYISYRWYHATYADSLFSILSTRTMLPSEEGEGFWAFASEVYSSYQRTIEESIEKAAKACPLGKSQAHVLLTGFVHGARIKVQNTIEAQAEVVQRKSCAVEGQRPSSSISLCARKCSLHRGTHFPV